LKKQSKFCQKSTESLFEAEHVLLFFFKNQISIADWFCSKINRYIVFFNRGAFGFASSAEKNHQPRATSEAKIGQKMENPPTKKGNKSRI
jgi:hypothetical protein